MKFHWLFDLFRGCKLITLILDYLGSLRTQSDFFLTKNFNVSILNERVIKYIFFKICEYSLKINYFWKQIKNILSQMRRDDV